MVCYRCNHEAGNNAECPICGNDLRVFQKVRRLSNMYYNDGLQKAEVRNLSGAIISLKKSLKLNKYNIEARNLLGLVYYEMGEVVDMVKDIEEAMYYHTVTKAMEGQEKMGDTYHNYYDMSRPQEHSKSRDTREGKSHMTRKVYMEARELN